MDGSLKALLDQGVITAETAMSKANDKSLFKEG
jgi:hypothetical protein